MAERIDDERYFDPEAPEGAPVRYLHEGCSKHGDRTLSVTRTGSGWKYKCHRCGARGFRPVAWSSASTIMRFHKAPEVQGREPRKVALPDPWDRGVYVPETLRSRIDSWLLKYEITEAEYVKAGLYLSKYGRLIFPVWDEDRKPIYWQGRSFFYKERNESKWINQKKLGASSILYTPGELYTTDEVALVEDMVSAIKVNRVIDAKALLGSSVPDTVIMELFKHYDTVYLWLDADKAEYSLKRVKRFRTFGYNVKRIYTPKDPKAYDDEQIVEILEKGGI